MGVDAVVVALEAQDGIAGGSVDKVKYPGRVKGLTLVAHFKMEMGAGAASGVASESDDFACLDHFVVLDQDFGQVSVVGFQSV